MRKTKNRNNATFINHYFLYYFILLGTIFLISSCTSTKPSNIFYGVLDEGYPLPEPSQWVEKIRLTNNNRSFLQNIKMEINDSKHMNISGLLKEFSYEVEEYKEREEYRYYAENGRALHWKKPYSIDVKTDVVKKWVTIIEPSIAYENPIGSNFRVVVDSSGYFNVRIPSNDQYYFKIPPNKKFYKVNKILKNAKIFPFNSSPLIIGEGYSFPIELFYYDIDLFAIDSYIKSQFSNIRIEIKDKITRLPINTNIKITTVNVPDENQIYTRFKNELQEDVIISKAISRIPDYVKKGQVIERNAQEILFTSIIGSIIQIETIHGKYYYFCSSLNVNKNSDMNKIILLTEKGEKVRVEKVEEGEGGELIDK